MSKAMVVLSGGQDSATCAAWAHASFDQVGFVTFDYGQRHKREIASARKIATMFGVVHEVYEIPVLANNPWSGLTNAAIDVRQVDEKSGLPRSFVPGRNLIFLSSAASIAILFGAVDLVTGVCQTDYSGYPDCRRETIDALETAIALGLGVPRFSIHTPLMNMTKAETVRLAMRLPQGIEAVSLSWTCYEGGDLPCATCPACLLRRKGFEEAGIDDPALSPLS